MEEEEEKLYRACSFSEIETYIKTGKLFPLNYKYVSLSENPNIGDIMCSPLHKFVIVFNKKLLQNLGAFKVEYNAKFMEEHSDIFYNMINNTVVEMNIDEFSDGDIPGTSGYEDIALIYKDYINSKGQRKLELEDELTTFLYSEFSLEQEWVIPKIEGFAKNVIDIFPSSMRGKNTDMKEELEYLKRLIIENYIK